MDSDSPSIEQIRQVHIVYETLSDALEIRIPYTSLEEGDGVWKTEDGAVLVKDYAFLRHPSRRRTEWKRVPDAEKVQEVRVYDWTDKKLIESVEL